MAAAAGERLNGKGVMDGARAEDAVAHTNLHTPGIFSTRYASHEIDSSSLKSFYVILALVPSKTMI